jgi:hypothetical protein
LGEEGAEIPIPVAIQDNPRAEFDMGNAITGLEENCLCHQESLGW